MKKQSSKFDLFTNKHDLEIEDYLECAKSKIKSHKDINEVFFLFLMKNMEKFTKEGGTDTAVREVLWSHIKKHCEENNIPIESKEIIEYNFNIVKAEYDYWLKQKEIWDLYDKEQTNIKS